MKPKTGLATSTATHSTWRTLLNVTAYASTLCSGKRNSVSETWLLSSLPWRETKKWQGHLYIHPWAFTDSPWLKGVVRLLRMQTRPFTLNTANACDKLWTSDHILCEKTALNLVKIPMPLAYLSKPTRLGVKKTLAKVVDCHGFQKWLSGNFFPTGLRCSGNVVCTVVPCPMGQSTWLERRGPHSHVLNGSRSSLVGKGKKGPQKRKRRAQGVVRALSRGKVNGGVSQWLTIV